MAQTCLSHAFPFQYDNVGTLSAIYWCDLLHYVPDVQSFPLRKKKTKTRSRTLRWRFLKGPTGFDCSQRTYITREVIATDGGNRSTSVELAVTITNVKNQPPEWEKESYSVVVPENTARDTPIVVSCCFQLCSRLLYPRQSAALCLSAAALIRRN